ncbi:DUF3179 domain-containing (seleno)protein [Jiulongibacter sp. NS-SX5]|uniref:DUF3179 domain-containing (seleno)protein n=1 Tax=Jiulongibacter sp. NS-SX5 TaxID=3463854 RepID=UPI004058229B
MKRYLICCFLIVGLISSCNKETITAITPEVELPTPEEAENWNIPVGLIKDAGTGRNGIISLDEPVKITTASANYLEDSDLVIGLKYGNTVVAYPHKILDYHEIVNDKIEDFAFAITYSPLSGSAVLFERNLANIETNFRHSGLVYNSNAILYDELTNSNWSQMLQRPVQGDLKDTETTFYQIIETNWANWKKWYPNSFVLGIPEVEIQPDYEISPYEEYIQNSDSLAFEVTRTFPDIPLKERILGIKVGEETDFVRFDVFGQLNGQITRTIGGEEIFIFGSGKDNYLMAYHAKTTSGEEIVFRKSLLGTEPELLFEDAKGNIWDIFGNCIEGDLEGEQLKKPFSMMTYSFAWAAFYS